MKITPKGMIKACALAVSGLLASPSWAVTDSPVANLTERWSGDAAGWARIGDGIGLWSAGALSVTYAQKTLADNPEISALFSSNAGSGGRFIGNYVQKKIDAACFDIKRDAFTGAVYLYIIAGGHTWQHAVPTPSGNGVWASVTVPLAMEGWTVSPLNIPLTAEQMKADLASVTEIGVLTYKTGMQKQGLFVDNFKLVGPWGQINADGVSTAWLQENGLTAGKDGALDDPDHDGVNNLAEFTAGTDPNSASSKFQVQILKNSQGQTVLRWQPQVYRTYSVMQSLDLVAGSEFAETMSGIQSAGPSSEVVVDEPGSGPYYYKVSVTQQIVQ